MDTRIRCQKITDDDYEQPRLPLLAKWWEDTFQKIGVDLRNETEAREIMESIPRYIIAALKDVRVHVDELSSEDDTIREPEPEDPSCHTTYVEVPQSASKSYPVNTRKQNQYMAFFKRRNPKLWRGVIKAKTFHDKADALMKSIVEDFVSWANENLADDEIDGISYEDVHRMFKYDTSISRCLHFETKRLGCIPDDPTNPGIENWRSTRLRKEILRDAKAYNRPKRTVAFGTCLPPELRSYPTRDTNFLKLSTWASSRRMRSLEGVFAGQTNLTSTKNYCKFLKENHPEVPLPDNITSDDVYEVEAGMWFKKSISSWKSR